MAVAVMLAQLAPASRLYGVAADREQGRLLVDSIARRDIPVVQTTIMLLSVTFVLVNLAVDLLYVKLDPRIQYD